MKENARQKKILELLSSGPAQTQEEIVNYLQREGFSVTQATVSRDLQKLNLSKVSEKGKKSVYKIDERLSADVLSEDIKKMPEDMRRLLRVLKEGFSHADVAQNILVIKTASGMAMAVAAALDSLHFKEIVGSIAGDDTIFCVAKTGDEAVLLRKRIQDIIKTALV
ncbi:MAG: arginine repressor [Lachnospiraceae bacterium]|nr:arginine repressor [Lachnospiraceae bacterium]